MKDEAKNLHQIAQRDRIFLIGAIALAINTWDVSFNLGAFGEIFFDKIFLLWTIATTTFVVFVFLPKSRRPLSWPGMLVLLLPSLWFLLSYFYVLEGPLILEGQSNWIEEVLFWAAFIISLVSLPYIFYVVVLATNIELVKLKGPRIKLAMVTVFVLIFIIGFVVGKNNNLFLSCHDFKISGNDIPSNCFVLYPEE